ncbi:ABC transporter ATP-binding protein [Martelella alba]|uniref:ABC transporter ATP-binding protein n=1 Tax=Martelella alba TaxID=2590451 RepID=A0ABY2SH18_9HYPH|nr:ABC transporter ATP-binding protein [Martelella alba]TKI04293.1 ABC transporter ATP-binding protein [Martelella alba]
MSSTALTISSLSKTFKTNQGKSLLALEEINLTIEEGEFVAIVGASGSGKSTLLRIISGLMEASSGHVQAYGKTISAPGADRAMVFQRDCLLPWKSVIDNVAYGLTLSGVRKREAHRRVQRYIDVAGLKGFEHAYPHQLSGGMRQRANVARAMAMDPKLLMMDEPFAALDSQTREIMQAELLRIWEDSRKTVLMITHQIDEAVYLADRIVVFSARPGKVKQSITVPFPRPRTLHLKRTPEFGAIVDKIWEMIEEEVKQSLTEG